MGMVTSPPNFAASLMVFAFTWSWCLDFLGLRELRPSFAHGSLLHVSAFAVHFGTQIWMSCISGIILYLRLPRHVFGQVQTSLFPAYFWFNCFLGLPTILYCPESFAHRWVLSACFLLEFVCLQIIVPSMKRTWAERMRLETKDTGPPLPNAQERMKRKFRVLHAFCAALNFGAMFCNCVHLCQLAAKLQR